MQGASSVGLISRLYEQIVEDLRQAIKAVESDDVELRTSRINHAILVIGHLQSQLDFEAGAKVAEALRNFYDSLRQNLIQAQLLKSKVLLAQQITDLLAVREAWNEVELAEKSSVIAVHENVETEALSTPVTLERKGWQG